MKNKKLKIALIFLCSAPIGLMGPGSVLPGNSQELSVNTNSENEYTVSRKLGRGVTNLSLGWMEVFNGVETARVASHDNLAAALTWGLAKGIGDSAKRTALGAYEIATFPVAGRKKYEPLMEPEFIFSPDSGRQP